MKSWQYLLLVIIFASSAYAKMSPAAKKVCSRAQSCYTEMVAYAGDKSLHTLQKEENKCDGLKKKCDRLLKVKEKSHFTLDQAYDDYQQAFKRYTSMVVTSPAKDESTIQKALQEYRDSYARYKYLKSVQQKSPSKPPKYNNNFDTVGIDGIVDIDQTDINIENKTAFEKKQIKAIDLVAKAKTIVPKPYDIISKVISKKGGIIRDNMMSLRIPNNALLNKKRIIVKRIHGALPRGKSSGQIPLPEAQLIGTPYDFGPDGTHFRKPVAISMKYNEKNIPSGLKKSNLSLAYYDGKKWIAIDSQHDTKTNTLTTAVNGFPGSIVILIGVPTILVSGGYALLTGVHKKIYQLIWDPIKKNWIHKYIKPKNRLVRKYAKLIGVTTVLNIATQYICFPFRYDCEAQT